MTVTRRIAALTVLVVTALPLAAGTAGAATHVRHVEPPVTVVQCEEGDGWVATDISEHREFCAGGDYDDRYVV
ncbi:hypothetical protein ACFQ6N_38055 [Kitasatospora sp. NPDC056446]|uniref:hypothetical protein n=1 Tax=Kitasatospora sp. NPDC056446 TaxID=3345819 RepID=UPI0036C16F94